MSSNILSREIDITKFGLIYASAQKNMGVAGVSIVIAHHDILKKKNKKISTIFDYNILASNKSIYNTPPVFSIYVTMLNLRWLKEQGGLNEIEKHNNKKAQLLYDEIDRNSLFSGIVTDISQRSQMNATFLLNKPDQESDFLNFAESRGITGIKGYKGYTGFRASLYNALPLESVNVLVNTMQEYECLQKT